MKKIIYILILFSIGTLTLNAQNSSYDFNLLDYNDQTINNQFFNGKDKSILIQNFGQPQSISKEYWDMDNDTAVVYHYKGIVFYIVKNLVYRFTIHGPQYGFSPYNIKVGEKLDRLQALFPLSFTNRKGNSIFLNIKENDSYVEIDADSNNLITRIDTGDY